MANRQPLGFWPRFLGLRGACEASKSIQLGWSEALRAQPYVRVSKRIEPAQRATETFCKAAVARDAGLTYHSRVVVLGFPLAEPRSTLGYML